MTVMGPNGMGKSTLLSLVAGIGSPYKGEIFINGEKRRGSVEEEINIRKNCFIYPIRFSNRTKWPPVFNGNW